MFLIADTILAGLFLETSAKVSFEAFSNSRMYCKLR